MRHGEIKNAAGRAAQAATTTRTPRYRRSSAKSSPFVHRLRYPGRRDRTRPTPTHPREGK